MKVFILSKLFNNKHRHNILRILAQNPMFSGLNTIELNVLSDMVHLRKYSIGEYIFKQGQPAIGMYIVSNGRVQLLNEEIYIDPQTEEDAKDSSDISILQEGDFIGELTLVNERAFRDFSAKAIEPTTLIALFRTELLEIIETRPVMATKILYNLSKLLAEQVERLIN